MPKCPACGHDNRAGAESCASCATSLNVRLCEGCEAINANSATHCHACGAALDGEASPTALHPTIEVTEVEPAARSLPATRTYADAPRNGARFQRVGLVLALPLVFLGGAAAYHFYFSESSSAGPTQVAGRVTRWAQPQAETPAPSPSAPAPSATAPAAASPIAVTQAPAEKAQGAVPPAAAPVPKKKASVAPAIVTVPSQSRVTHTKPGAEPAVQPVVQPESAVQNLKDGAAGSKHSAACAAGVAALGLCK